MITAVKEKPWLTPLQKQIWVISAPIIYLFCVGMVLGYPSVLLPALRKDPNMKPDLLTESWIASTVGLAGMFGYFAIGFSMEVFGRKWSQILVIVSGALGWALIYSAKSLDIILAGRVLCGINVGCSIGLSAVIISEYSCPEYRGVFLNVKSTASTLGSVFVHILQFYVSWKIVALIALILNIVPAIIVLVSFPESPSWLVSKKKYEDCENSFFWLRGKNVKTVQEHEEMVEAYKKEQTQTDDKVSICKKTMAFFRNFQRKNFYMPLVTIFIGVVVMEMSGRHIFVSYASDIVERISGKKSGGSYILIGVDSILTICSIISPILIKKLKRRSYLFLTGIASLVVLALFCIYMALQTKQVISKDYSGIPIALFIIYFLLASLGCSPIPYVLLGELLPVKSKGMGTAIVGVILSVCLQISLQTQPFLLSTVDVYGTFAITGTALAIGLLILYFILPETKDKTLTEIDNFYMYGVYHIEQKENTVVEQTQDVKTKQLDDKELGLKANSEINNF